MRVCAIVPIKQLSTRVPGKNYRDFNGEPLMKIIINTLLQSNLITTLVVDTNSKLVKEILTTNYTDDRIIIYDRREHLWAGDTPTNVLLENVIYDLDLTHDIFIQTHVTNPLLSVKTLDSCIHEFIEKERFGYDSLFTVKKIQTRLYTLENDIDVVALNHNPDELIPTQDLKPLYEENSCVYIFKRDILVKRHHRIGYKPYMYLMDDIESSDIDTETDFTLTETLHKQLVLDPCNLQTSDVSTTNNQIDTSKKDTFQITKGIDCSEKHERVVLVTGASQGIGLEICKKFKSCNWIVVGVALSDTFSHSSIDTYICKDLCNEYAAHNIINEISEKYGKLNCIVNNAAMQICKPFWEMESDEWSQTFDCNVKNIFLLAKYGLSLLKESRGNIVNIGSVHSVATSDKITAYASSKAALTGLTRNLAIEMGRFGIRVNCICPGAVDTEMLRDGLSRGHNGLGTSSELIKILGKRHLLGVVGQPDEIANLVEFVANDDNGRFINGANFIIDGGASIKLSTE